jgi:hypothetical protein
MATEQKDTLVGGPASVLFLLIHSPWLPYLWQPCHYTEYGRRVVATVAIDYHSS